jgi:acyl-CoA hydrolase
MTAEEKSTTKTAGKKASSAATEEKVTVNEGSAALAELIGKPVSASRSQMVEVVLPNDANQLGYILGGRVMHLMDIAAAIAAHRHSNGHVVTASVDYVDFRHSIKIGDLIILKSSVNRVFKTSMEVGVKVFSESTFTGEHKHTSSAYLTFVAIDAQHRPRAVPPLILETDEDRRRWTEAEGRRKIRLAQRYKNDKEKR